ncbi:MAG TPA: hypothetical protein VHV10_05220 [Ktedonobacteraceae bacterium]|jgi:hypothetical protein|nr:hypothetical protein [Ktedonobacteraceae bacterium]
MSKRKNLHLLRVGKIKQSFTGLIESISDQDRLWFEQHPSKDQYVRDYKAGEFKDQTPPMNTQVLVTKVSADVRVRTVIPYDVADLSQSGMYIFIPEVEEIRDKMGHIKFEE